MRSNVSIIGPDTRSALSSALRSGGGLPPDLLAKAQRRLAVLAAILAVNSLIAFLIAPPLWSRLGIEDPGPIHPIQLAFIVSSTAMFLIARFGPAGQPVILGLGLLYEVSLCFFGSLGQSAMFYAWTGQVPITNLAHVLIVAFPLIVPNTPGRTLLAAAASAATVPASLSVLQSGGASIPPAALVAPTVFGAFSVAIAVVGSRLVYGLSRDAAAARAIGSYQLDTLLGQGGMGEVWRAQHRLLARPAAIKLIRPDWLGGDAGHQHRAIARFEREAQATASLRSPHTIELYDFGVSDSGTFYYVMELLQGFDAAQLVERFGPMPAERVVHLLVQTCDSLAEAHEAGLVHRDVKPSNIYVCRYGRAVDFVKVLDFGLVKPRDVGASPQLTTAQAVSGTPAYMAPEQVVADADLDARADLYAVGCVAYWLLTGCDVFEGTTAMQVMVHHAQSTPVAPSARTELSIPAALDQLVLDCLAKDPAKRPQTADELARALQATVTGDPWTPERARNWWERHAP